MSKTKKTVTAVNLSTLQENTFLNMSPAHAVAYSHYEETGSLTDFFQLTQDGKDWDEVVTKGNYSVIMGNWCALCATVDRK